MKLSFVLILIVLSVITCASSAYVAHKKGKSPLLWFVIGFALNIITLLTIVYLFQMTKNTTVDKKAPNDSITLHFRCTDKINHTSNNKVDNSK